MPERLRSCLHHSRQMLRQARIPVDPDPDRHRANIVAHDFGGLGHQTHVAGGVHQEIIHPAPAMKEQTHGGEMNKKQ